MHTQVSPIVHRDLKPNNVLLDEFDNIKICDFGLSHTYQSSSMTATTDMAPRPNAGPEVYKAPETWDVSEGVKIDEKCDIYSFGILLHELFVGTVPWGEKSREHLLTYHIVKHASPPAEPILKEKYPKIAAIFEECCRNDSSKRPTAHYVLQALREAAPSS